MTLYDSQLGLFGTDDSPQFVDTSLGTKLPRNLRFGTSSWTFEGWEGLLYRKTYQNPADFRQHSLGEYASHPLFRTVGVDRSFYRPLDAKAWKAYADQLPEGFRAVIKVWNRITDTRIRTEDGKWRPNPFRFDADLLQQAVLAAVQEGFADHVGALLFQLSGRQNPRMLYTGLASIRPVIPDSMHPMVELRDPTLFGPDYLQALQDCGFGHCFNFWGDMPSLERQLSSCHPPSSERVILRLMLPKNVDYQAAKEAYAPFNRIVQTNEKMRRDAIAILTTFLEAGSEVYVIVNNKAEGCSPKTVEALAKKFLVESG